MEDDKTKWWHKVLAIVIVGIVGTGSGAGGSWGYNQLVEKKIEINADGIKELKSQRAMDSEQIKMNNLILKTIAQSVCKIEAKMDGDPTSGCNNIVWGRQ